MLDSKAADKFYGHEQDNFAQAKLIAHWLDKHDRKNSPKFLNGVSYGGHRCCLIPRYLMGGLNVPGDQLYAVGLNGIIMMGDVCLADTNYESGDDMPPAGDIPDICYNVAGYAATNWYHHPDGKPDQNIFVDDAHAFAFHELLEVLKKGDEASETEKRTVAEKLAGYIGVKSEIILEMKFALDMMSFCHILALADEGKAVGVYDGRCTLPGGAITTPTFDMIADDPAEARTWTATAALVSEIYKKEYGIAFSDGRGYVHENFEAYHMWDWRIQEGTKPVDWQLFNMRHQQDMNLMIVSGLYDLCWNTGYSRYEAECAGFPAERTELKIYPSGHAVYFDEETRHMMAKDFRDFIRKSV